MHTVTRPLPAQAFKIAAADFSEQRALHHVWALQFSPNCNSHRQVRLTHDDHEEIFALLNDASFLLDEADAPEPLLQDNEVSPPTWDK